MAQITVDEFKNITVERLKEMQVKDLQKTGDEGVSDRRNGIKGGEYADVRTTSISKSYTDIRA